MKIDFFNNVILAVISLITTFILVSYYHIGEDENIYLRISYFRCFLRVI